MGGEAVERAAAGLRTAVAAMTATIADRTAKVGTRVLLDPVAVIDRSADIALAPPGLISPNRHCRLLQAADGWIALNLARPSDHDLVAPWAGQVGTGDPWADAASHAAKTPVADLIDVGVLLGLPIAAVGETASLPLDHPRLALGSARRGGGRLSVLDMSALWAGPLCGAILAAAGAAVIRVEDPDRPDPGIRSTPRHFARLNEGKVMQSLSFGTAAGRDRLFDMACAADILITSARPRAFAGLGLAPEQLFAGNPGLVWIAITGHGWSEPHDVRVAFGDDAAVAGGLIGRVDGTPRFLGDALADPLTGMDAALCGIDAVERGGGVLIDVAMARAAARIAIQIG